MKKSLFAIAALAVAGIGFMGCDEILNDPCNGLCTSGKLCVETINQPAACYDEDAVKAEAEDCESGKLQYNEDKTITCAEAQTCGDSTCEIGTYCVTALDENDVEVQGCAAEVPNCNDSQVHQWQEDGTVLCINAIVQATCQSNADCAEEGYVCVEGSCIKGEESAELTGYKYVRIDDLTDRYEACCGDKDGCEEDGEIVCSKEDPGADIDAIALKKADDGSVSYAVDVVEYKNSFIKGGTFYKEDNTMALDPKKATGAPDSLFEYASATGLPADDAQCRYVREGITDGKYGVDDYTFVSLGGEGGYLIVEMEKPVANDDTVDVLEVGDCEMITSSGGNISSSNVMNEEIKIQVSVNGSDGWVVINEGASATNGLISTKVAGL